MLLKFNKTKLQRVLKSTRGTKRKMELPIESKSKCCSSSTSLQSTCIFCGNESGQLHHCSTFNLDQELKQMATEKPSAFRRWMIAGPEQARLLTEFEVQFVCSDEETNLPHHEQNQSVQDLFHKHVQDLCATISDMGNPFLEKCPELLTLHTRHCASDSVIETVRTISV